MAADKTGGEVVIVLSDAFASQLDELARRSPLWALRTGELERAAEADWKAHPEIDGKVSGVTLFSGPTDPEQALLAVLDDVDEHHGAHSQAPAATELRVLGAEPTIRVRAALTDLGFIDIDAIADGFVARRTRAAS